MATCIQSDDDCANFDEEFTCEPVVDSYTQVRSLVFFLGHYGHSKSFLLFVQKGKILSQNADAFSGFEFSGHSSM
jgi:hypothetical protein